MVFFLEHLLTPLFHRRRSLALSLTKSLSWLDRTTESSSLASSIYTSCNGIQSSGRTSKRSEATRNPLLLPLPRPLMVLVLPRRTPRPFPRIRNVRNARGLTMKSTLCSSKHWDRKSRGAESQFRKCQSLRTTPIIHRSQTWTPLC